MTGLFFLPLLFAQAAQAPVDRISYPGKEASSPKIVLISGDEEYRSEEALPQLAKILSKHHGFRTVVLFSLDPKTGVINPDINNNIPGTEELRDANLVILGLRFRNLPEEQMKEIVAYVDSGRPIIGLRTSTHAFNIPKGKPYATWSWDHGDPHKGGFGKQVLGETWVSHHGNHGSESTLALIAPDAASHPILKGIKSGDIWGPTDVYGVDLPADAKPLLLGQVLAGMKKDSKPVEGKKNDPMMPVAWTREVKSASGKPARIFTTTMGAATDLENEPLRQLLVNAAFWAMGKEGEIPEKAEVAIVGEYKPTKFGFKGYIKGKKPADYR
jgi:type 1 glutamine amidotransferase